MARVYYFTAGHEPDENELADIGQIEAGTDAPFTLVVMAAGNRDYTGYLTDAEKVQPDYVAAYDLGAIPDAYADADVLDPANLPWPVSAGQAVVTDGQEIAGTGGTFAVDVTDGAITGGVWTPA